MENTKTKIREIIAAYKADFERIDSEERYKWIAVKCFQDNWDIDDTDFHAMLVKSFDKCENLLRSAHYFPYKAIAEFAKQEPETVRSLFRVLYNEALPLDERIAEFQEVFEQFVHRQNLRDSNWKKSFQDLHAVSVYLAFKYPDKYYIFKSSVYKKLADYVGFLQKHNAKEKYANCTDLFDLIREIAIADDELTTLSRNRLTEDCFADSHYRMLAMDIAYFGYGIAKADVEAADKVNDWFPADYSPGISVDQWAALINDNQVFYTGSLEIMRRIKDYGGEATCKELSNKYGGTPNFYNAGSSSLAKRVAQKTGCPVTIRNNEDSKWWPVLYFGKYADKNTAGFYVWKLRDELNSALEKCDLSSVRLYAAADDGTDATPPSNIYTTDNFLDDVYMEKKQYDTLAAQQNYRDNKQQCRHSFKNYSSNIAG
jgi:5-methylcytosine-specific restriction protein B